MRLTLIVALLLLPASATAQPSPCTPSQQAQFDPYNPSDAALMRNFGGTMLAQAPLSALMKLDPYVPTEAALLRQLGGAIPVWAFPAYPAHSRPPGSTSHAVPCEPVRESAAAASPALRPALTTFNEVLAALPAAAMTSGGTTLDTVTQRSRGISIQHDGRVWVSAGPAVPFTDANFERVGERAGSPIYRRAGGDADVVYIRTTAGLVAPFRVAR
jgi:hypothetical protein